jgi:1,6-anhydro-N-acetylmuramate kinase
MGGTLFEEASRQPYQLGVPDKTIQAILRHSNVALTQARYIKTSNADAVEAMLTLEHATNVQLEQADAQSKPANVSDVGESKYLI